ncbi:adenylate cyclase [Pseudozobellia thermophila]|uniref:Adenylate cyclase n=2 Tax=Pseudozobellia thermophila TaxID=192903 RepID=A0A1M6GAA7_9FLAO|nr:adenylate cyclase [Pseudozobellia thermophila]
MGLFALFRFYGLTHIESIRMADDIAHLSMGEIMGYYILTGLSLGLLYALVEFAFEKYSSKRLAIGPSIAIRTITYFLSTIAVFTLLVGLISDLSGINIDNGKGWWLKNRILHATLLYIFIASLVFSFLKIAREKFGRGLFIKMLLGTYKKPKEEKRIFMFLDLKDSTAIAEKLGHLKYSQFIQDFFYDLNEVVPRFDAEIYQYVGDEAVLSWSYNKGVAKANCVKVFFAFEHHIKKRGAYYRERYGLIPRFKAGLHGGFLMVAEVGSVKKELAYHGDVINTAARIQEECNNHKASLLISETLLNELDLGSTYLPTSLGSILLKGKHSEINVYTIEENR